MDVVTLLKELIKIRSDNPGNYEEDIAIYISNLLKEHDIDHEIIYSGERRANIIGYLYGETDSTLIFNGHLDTKPADNHWKTNPFTPVIKDKRLYGLGAADMKGGLAAMISAIIESSKMKLKGNVNFLFVADEEMNSSFGLKYLVKHGYIDKGEFAIVAEPTNLRLATRSLGNLWVTVKVQGKKAHAGMYWKGVNAIDLIIEIINQMKKVVNSRKYKEISELANFPNLNIGIIKGGSHPGSVPEYCESSIEIRFKDETEKEFFMQQLRKIINNVSSKYGCECIVDYFGGGGLPPWDLMSLSNKKVHKYTRYIEQSYMSVAHQPLEKCTFLGGSDAGIFASVLKIPTVIIGPGSLEQAHNPNEWVYVDEVVKASKIYEEIIKRWE